MWLEINRIADGAGNVDRENSATASACAASRSPTHWRPERSRPSATRGRGPCSPRRPAWMCCCARPATSRRAQRPCRRWPQRCRVSAQPRALPTGATPRARPAAAARLSRQVNRLPPAGRVRRRETRIERLSFRAQGRSVAQRLSGLRRPRHAAEPGCLLVACRRTPRGCSVTFGSRGSAVRE